MKPKILTKAQITSLRREVAVRDEYQCVLCGRPAADICHIVPRSHGVKNSAVLWSKKNLACCCRACHQETKAQRRRFLERMRKLYNYDYSMQPWRQYLISPRREKEMTNGSDDA